MNRPPRSKKEPLIDWKRLLTYVYTGFIIAFTILITYWLWLPRGHKVASTVAFSLFVFQELLRSFSSRSENEFFFKLGLSKNKFLIISVLIGFLLQFIILYSPLGTAFKVNPLTIKDLLLMFVLSPIPLMFSELRKVIFKI